VLITKLLFITGVVYTLVFLITFFIEKRYTESALPFFFAIIVFGYAFAYRHLLLQQKKKGKKGNEVDPISWTGGSLN
jgi:4-hydroxybenzoate polyprenyltransferase